MSREPPNWYDHNADNPPWSNAPAEVRLLAPRERCCFLHAQAIIVAIDQHAVKALGNREYFLDRAGSAENGEFQAKPVAPCIEPLSDEAVVFERLQDAVTSRPRQTRLPLNVSEPQPSAPAVTQQVQNVDRTIEHLRATGAVVSRGDGTATDLGGIIGHRDAT